MIAFGAGALLGSLLSPTEPERRAAREVQPALESAASEAGGQAQQIDTTVCNLDGAQAFAEIVIVEEFRRNGWDAVWMDRKRYWSAMYEFVDDIRVEQREFVAVLLSRAGSRGGAWTCLRGVRAPLASPRPSVDNATASASHNAHSSKPRSTRASPLARSWSWGGPFR